MSDEKSKVLLDEALRRLNAQDTELGQIRTRAGALLSAITIATSFLGANLIRTKGLSPLSWIAVALFVGAFLPCLWVLAGRVSGWVSGFSPRLVKEHWLEQDDATEDDLTSDEVRYHLALFVEEGTSVNEVKLRTRRTALLVSGLILTAEVVFWILDLAHQGGS